MIRTTAARVASQAGSALAAGVVPHRRAVALVATLVAFLLASPAIADPLQHPHPACRAYQNDFPRRCRCEGRHEYFTTYGLKYCNRFMRSRGFSAAGTRWRDLTRSCLQGRISRRLAAMTAPECDCAGMRRFAFASHVACYTRHDPSVCRLPLGDLAEIFRLIDGADLFLSAEGLMQVLAVATICGAEAPQPSRPIDYR